MHVLHPNDSLCIIIAFMEMVEVEHMTYDVAVYTWRDLLWTFSIFISSRFQQISDSLSLSSHIRIYEFQLFANMKNSWKRVIIKTFLSNY